MADKYLVLSSSSTGYQLLNLESKEISFHPHRKKVSFKNEKIIIGDEVFLDEAGFINQVCERKNLLKRPRLSNVDDVLILTSCVQPDFSSYLLDKFISLINYSSIHASIVMTKVDLINDKKKEEELRERMSWYSKISYPVYFVNAHDKSSYDFSKLENDIKGKRVAFVGQTGVGKSSLLNSLDSNFTRKVDSLYVTSGRGRHTTKEVVMLPYNDGYLLDTPGFSALELTEMKRKDLSLCFPGYSNYLGKCYFTDCLHENHAKGCEVLKAIEEGMLSTDSYSNYLKILEEVKENEKWKKKI